MEDNQSETGLQPAFMRQYVSLQLLDVYTIKHVRRPNAIRAIIDADAACRLGRYLIYRSSAVYTQRHSHEV